MDKHWEVLNVGCGWAREYHIVPLDDKGTHTLDDSCDCEPKRWIDNPNVVVHHAFDHRTAPEIVDAVIQRA